MIDKEYAQSNALGVDHGALIVEGQTANDASVIVDSPADKAGIKEGDIITTVNGKAVNGKSPLGRLIGAHKPGDRITITLVRDGKEKTVMVILEEYKLK